jgi:hypothetical protein
VPQDIPAAAAPQPSATLTPRAHSASEPSNIHAGPTPQPAAAPAHLSLATPSNQPPEKNAAGIDTALIGRTYQHELLMNGFKVPLPQGEWAVLASFNIWVVKSPQNKGMTYFLGRIEKGRLVGAMIVNALTARKRSWPSIIKPAGSCIRCLPRHGNSGGTKQ